MTRATRDRLTRSDVSTVFMHYRTAQQRAECGQRGDPSSPRVGEVTCRTCLDSLRRLGEVAARRLAKLEADAAPEARAS